MGFSDLGLSSGAIHYTISEAFLIYSLFTAMFALGAAAVYFLVERDTILPAYRATMATSAIICGVAAIAYFFIAAQYSPGRGFPTVIRYFDWTITTPLLLLKYHEMLRVRGSAFAWKLILADLFMIVTGFIGELYGTTLRGHWYPNVPGAIGAHYVWGAVSTLGYLGIVFLVLTEGTHLAKTQPEPIQHGIKAMNLYLLSLWGVYPIVYWFEGLSASHLAWVSIWTGLISQARWQTSLTRLASA